MLPPAADVSLRRSGLLRILQEAGIADLVWLRFGRDVSMDYAREGCVQRAHAFSQCCGARLQDATRRNLIDVIVPSGACGGPARAQTDGIDVDLYSAPRSDVDFGRLEERRVGRECRFR